MCLRFCSLMQLCNLQLARSRRSSDPHAGDFIPPMFRQSACLFFDNLKERNWVKTGIESRPAAVQDAVAGAAAGGDDGRQAESPGDEAVIWKVGRVAEI